MAEPARPAVQSRLRHGLRGGERYCAVASVRGDGPLATHLLRKWVPRAVQQNRETLGGTTVIPVRVTDVILEESVRQVSAAIALGLVAIEWAIGGVWLLRLRTLGRRSGSIARFTGGWRVAVGLPTATVGIAVFVVGLGFAMATGNAVLLTEFAEELLAASTACLGFYYSMRGTHVFEGGLATFPHAWRWEEITVLRHTAESLEIAGQDSTRSIRVPFAPSQRAAVEKLVEKHRGRLKGEAEDA